MNGRKKTSQNCHPESRRVGTKGLAYQKKRDSSSSNTLWLTQNDILCAAFTLVETLIVVAIIVILSTMVVGITSRISNKAKEHQALNSFAILDAALQELCDYGWSYNFYKDFKFPLDVTEPVATPVPQNILELILETEYAPAKVSIEPVDPAKPIFHSIEYVSSELLYFFLNKVPECRTIIDKIDESLKTNKDFSGNEMKLVIDDGVQRIEYPLLRFVDPWHERSATARIGKTMIYDYSYEYKLPSGQITVVKRSFPVIRSAGPDGIFGNSDDISSR